MKTILVPTDFSRTALNAAIYALAFAGATKSAIMLFHVYKGAGSDKSIPYATGNQLRQEASAKVSMEKLINSLTEKFPSVRIKHFITSGTPSSELINYTKQKTPSLIIMGTTGQGEFKTAVFGSTTSNVIANAVCPVMAVPPKAKFKGISSIAVATDLKKDNLGLARESILFAKQFKADLTFVHIQDLETFDANNDIQKNMEKIRKESTYKKISFLIYMYSNIEYGIDFYVAQNKPDILSMMTHGYWFPETLWKTSWTNRMTSHLTLPLLVMHANK